VQFSAHSADIGNLACNKTAQSIAAGKGSLRFNLSGCTPVNPR
jgi:hypothetical protein